jgi:uncharacterized C2H2 Zn-finger protein
MDKNYLQCPRCYQEFSSSQRLQTHLNKKIPCRTLPFQSIPIFKKKITVKQLKNDDIICSHCLKHFVRPYGLERHIMENRCKQLKQINDKKSSLYKNKVNLLENQLNQLKEKQNIENQQLIQLIDKRVTELKDKPSTNITNQILQVVSISSTDNYLDMLTERWSSFDRALEYIKDCALSNLTGDCKLIEKIYFNQNESQLQSSLIPIRAVDKNRTKIEYFNDKKKKFKNQKNYLEKK